MGLPQPTDPARVQGAGGETTVLATTRIAQILCSHGCANTNEATFSPDGDNAEPGSSTEGDHVRAASRARVRPCKS